MACIHHVSSNGGGEDVATPESLRRAASSASFRSLSRKKPNMSSSISRTGSEVDEFISLMHGSDPLRVELTRLENEVRDKDRELGDAHIEIRALKYSERLKEKAVEELSDELNKVDEKLKASEVLLEIKNLEIRKTNEEKKAALAAQFAAEATLRRVHAAQKDDEMPPIEAIIAPLEAELKLARTEVAKLQDDNRALDRLTKSKEAALLEAERAVQTALAKASVVDDLQNKNQELLKQIEICQEENRILDKMHRQKVAEVEKLTQTVRELEEAVLTGGAAANAVRDYQRKVQEINEEKRILDRELARAKVSANRVAVVVANEWKDANDKVMPVKQWIDERRHYQGEMQQLRDKLVVAERAAKAETQLKEKYQLRFKVLEETLKASCNGVSRIISERKTISSGHSRRMSLGGAESFSRSYSNGFLTRNIQPGPLQKHANGRSMDSDKLLPNSAEKNIRPNHAGDEHKQSNGITCIYEEHEEGNPTEKAKTEYEDYVSGKLYDMLQQEVLALRKACQDRSLSLKDKDDAIQMLTKNVETLNKALEVERKRMRREISVKEKEIAAMRIDKERDQRALRPKAAVNGPQSLSTRNSRNAIGIRS